MVLELDFRSNLFSPSEHLCAVTYLTEISFDVTLNNQSSQLNLSNDTKINDLVILYMT